MSLASHPLSGVRVLAIVGDDYEDLELWYPKLRLEEAGAHVTVAGTLQGRTYTGKHGYPCTSDAAIGDMEATDFHGILLPGGWMPDKLRRDEKVLALVRDFAARGQLVAAICHGGWIAISAGVYRGVRGSWTGTSSPAANRATCRRSWRRSSISWPVSPSDRKPWPKSSVPFPLG
jgi:protease I